jgi:ABC-2 type transport system permease protein
LNIWDIAWKDLKTFLRGKTRVIFSVLMPIIMMLMLGFIFPKAGGSYSGNIGIYSHDLLFNAKIEKSFSNTSTTKMVFYNSRQDLIDALASGKIMVGAIIPKDFSVAVMLHQPVTMDVIPSPANPQAGIMMSQELATMFGSAGVQNIKQNVQSNLVNADGTAFNYYDFTVPGLMAMIAIMSVMTGLASAITRERELGTLDGVMVTPISRGSIVIGKVLAQTIRGFVTAMIILAISWLFFGVHFTGISLLWTIFLLLLGTFSFIGVGVMITAAMKEQETAMITMTTITFPMMFFSGVFFPIQQMPHFMQYIAYIFPLTYAADALRNIITLNVGWNFIWVDVVVLVGFAVVTSLIAAITFQRLTQD